MGRRDEPLPTAAAHMLGRQADVATAEPARLGELGEPRGAGGCCGRCFTFWRRPSQARGTLIVLFGMLWLVPDALFLKLGSDKTGWRDVFMRSFLCLLTYSAGILLVMGRASWATSLRWLGWRGPLLSLLFAPNAVLFTMSLKHTTAASAQARPAAAQCQPAAVR